MNQRSDTTLVETSEIEEQLERMLASETFARATRLSQLLRYVVSHSLGDNAEYLKEYTLGLEAPWQVRSTPGSDMLNGIKQHQGRLSPLRISKYPPFL